MINKVVWEYRNIQYVHIVGEENNLDKRLKKQQKKMQ